MQLVNIKNFIKTSARNNHGFTLIEVLVSISIFALIVGATVEIYLFARNANDIVWEQLKTQNEGRKVIQDFTNELRTATASSIGAYSIESAAGNHITFYSDFYKDTFRERIRYFMSSTTLRRGIIKPTGNPLTYNSANEVFTDIAHDVANASNTIFTYYDNNFTGTSAPLANPVDVTKIRMVGITLELEENPRASPAPFYISSKVMIRNLKDN